MIKQVALCVLLAGTAGAAVASEPFRNIEADKGWQWDFWHKHSTPVAAPEMDPASAVSGLTLLLGGVAIAVAGRRRKAIAA